MNRYSRFVRVVGCTSLALAPLFYGCDSSGSTDPEPVNSAPIAFLQVVQEVATVDIGQTVRIGVDIRSATGQPIVNRPVNWSSSDPQAVAVSGAGMVTGVALGGSLVVAEAEGFRDTVVVYARRPYLTSAIWGYSTPLRLNVPSEPITVSSGDETACTIDPSGVAYCWGRGPREPTRVFGPERFATIVPATGTGGSFSCGLNQQGKAYCWGSNDVGQLGDGNTAKRIVPVPVSGGLTFAAITAAQAHACGLTAAGEAYCWGDNFAGGLGDGTLVDRAIPTRVIGGKLFASITAGDSHTCALTAEGEAFCWGENDDGEGGNGTISPQGTGLTTPTRVATSIRFSSISAGAEHVCAVALNGDGYCWGWSLWGQLGRSGFDGLPGKVEGNLKFSAIGAGGFHTCGLDLTGKAYCWGISAFGELGDGAPIRPMSAIAVMNPVAVIGGLTFQQLSVGTMHTCGLTTSHALYCWGHNENGALGIP